MTRTPKWLVAVAAAGVLLGTACSDGDDGDRGAGVTTTTTLPRTTTTLPPTTGTPTPSTTVAPSGAPTTQPVASTAQPAGSTTSVAPATTLPTAGAVATAGGWRMVITQPVTSSTLGSVAVVCYEVTGPTREALVAFDVTILGPLSIGPFRAPAAVGRGTARASLPPVPPGRYDLRIQLLLEGAQLEGAVVTIAGVNVVSGGTQVAAC